MFEILNSIPIFDIIIFLIANMLERVICNIFPTFVKGGSHTPIKIAFSDDIGNDWLL